MLKQELIDLSDKVLEFIKDSPGVSVITTEYFGW